MEISQKKEYIHRYITKGIPLGDAYTLVYATDEEKDIIDEDEEFQALIREVELDLTADFLEKYNKTVNSSRSAADHLKRMQQFRPKVFADDDKDKLPDLNITIRKKGPDED